MMPIFRDLLSMLNKKQPDDAIEKKTEPVKKAEEYLKAPLDLTMIARDTEILSAADAYLKKVSTEPEDEIEVSGVKLLKNGHILFGRYEQEIGKTSPLEWIPLRVTDDSILIVTLKGIDTMPFDSDDCDWEDSELREWMNGDFIRGAFNDEERKLIVRCKIRSNTYNWREELVSHNDTEDEVFALSVEEVETLFRNSDEMKAEATEYAIRKGVYHSDNVCWYWWMRNPGREPDCTMNCRDFDYVDKDGKERSEQGVAVRPALYFEAPKEIIDAVAKAKTTVKERLSDSWYDVFDSKRTAEVVFEMVHGKLEERPGEPELQRDGNILFGRYPQENGEIKPIEWRVLERKNGEILMVSEYVLDARSFSEDEYQLKWENSDLRKWLNRDFINGAFSEKERRIILPKRLKNPGNREYGYPDDPETTDRVFLLSAEEIERYMPEYMDAVCDATGHGDVYVNSDTGTAEWWLRTTGLVSSDDPMDESCTNIAIVDIYGTVEYRGNPAGEDWTGVRPAMCIKITDWFIEEEKMLYFLTQFSYEEFLNDIQETLDGSTGTSLNEEDARYLAYSRKKAYRTRLDLAGGRIMRNGNVIFGHYRTDDASIEPLTWIPLAETEQGVIMISAKAIDCLPINSASIDVNWAECDLRKWLNSDFMDLTFNDDEKKLLETVSLKTKSDKEYIETEDKVFLLSSDEVDQYFVNNEARIAAPTLYAVKRGIQIRNKACKWWMRSQERIQLFLEDGDIWVNQFETVGEFGNVHLYRNSADEKNIAVRPAIVLKLIAE